MRNVRVRGNSDGQIPLAKDVKMPISSKSEGSRIRAIFAPATPHPDSIARPTCSQCGTATLLVGIEPERPGYDLHTFQCPDCEHFEIAVGKAA
jgi:hypothetical protein